MRAEYFDNPDLQGEPKLRRVESRAYFEMELNLSLTWVIFPDASVIATMECSSSAALTSLSSLSAASNCASFVVGAASLIRVRLAK